MEAMMGMNRWSWRSRVWRMRRNKLELMSLLRKLDIKDSTREHLMGGLLRGGTV
jgi:hypothetical protein